MNYFSFYNKAKEQLIDSLASLWFKGQAREQEYIKRVLTEDEPLFAEPVFQSIFPWEESADSFEEHYSKLRLLTSSFVKALSSEEIDKDLRFPLDRHPYKHQTESWRIMLSPQPKTIVVTTGTGSGKTECFMIPVLQDLAKTNEKNCVQAIFLYPLNALMKSQRERIHAWCKALPEKVTYAIYNGETDKENRSDKYTAAHYPQLVTRPQIRNTPPQILFTNPTMLNYMLVRAEDREILEKSRGKLKWILLDEAHTYTGSSAAELSLQIRRVLDAFGVTIDQVNFAVTSATIGDESDPKTMIKLKAFVSQLTGKPFKDIKIISGKRIVPELNEDIAKNQLSTINNRFGTELTYSDIENLRKKLNSSPALKATEIGSMLDEKIGEKVDASLEIIDALGERVQNLNKGGEFGALLPTRANLFVRSISGVYVCTNPDCQRHKGYRLPIGSLTTYQNINCPVCKSKMLELATCSSCGSPIVVGETSTTKGFRMHTNVIDLDKMLFYEQKEDLIDLEDMESTEDVERNEADGFSRFFFAIPEKPCLKKNVNRAYHIFNHKTGKIELVPEDNGGENIPVKYQSLRHSENNHVLCPHCGNNLSEFKNLDYLRISATQIGRTLATLLLDNAEPIDSNDADVVYEGRRYITFTDSRQGSARSAMGLNQDVERSWIRASIFHKLADIRLNDVKPGGLTSEEEEEYNGYLSIRDPLPPVLLDKFKQLEDKKYGSPVIPDPEEVSWEEISLSLENDSNFKKLYKHIDNAQGKKNSSGETDYLKALLVDQFGWIPKRANSLETMGFVHLVYPALKNAKCPELLRNKGCTNTDWQNFLKICMDYVIRGGRHYMLSENFKIFLTQNKYCSPIYPSNSKLRKNGIPVSKWFKVNVSPNGIDDNQNRLVLLLCAVLGYDDISEINDGNIADINSILDKAWDFLINNVLEERDTDNHGYMLDLTGKKVKLQLIEKGYLCPVDNVIIDAPFCGYSPRMNGYIGRENFDRFKIEKEFVNPFFPFKSTDLKEKEKDVMEWIENNFSDQKAAGVFGVMNSRVLVPKPIFISAEHSAQQSSKDLDRYEKEFNDGKINILSCSTTMEMGVDIGGVTEVVMNNVPPKSSNYLQRAGRAGRRSETKAMVLTVCAPNPIGTHIWNNPDYPITHVTETPLLRLESRQLIQRHVNALVFASFVAAQGGIKVTATLEDFFIQKEGMSFYDKFLNYVDSVISGDVGLLQESYLKLINGTSLDQITLPDAAQVIKKDIIAVHDVFDAHNGALAKTIESLNDRDGTKKAIKAIERQKYNLLKTSMLSYLAENSFLPSAGLPLGLVECLLGRNENIYDNSPTLHISQAISSYAPGNTVVKNEWVYEPCGIRLKTKYDDNTSRYIIQNCTHCGYTTIIYGTPKTDCPKCGHPMHGIKDMSLATDPHFTEVVEPAAFSVAWNSTPTRKMDTIGGMNFIQPILLEMDPWLSKTNSAKMSIRCSTPRSEILFYNKGTNGYGYAFCPYCGRMKSETSPDSNEHIMSGHKHLLASTTCPGGENNGASVRRHVLLVGRYQTDFVEIKFYDNDNNLVEDSETLYSLGVILSRKLTELLGVNDGEIEFGYDSINHSIFIYDTALGGAGYSLLFREYKDEVLKMALETLERCDCERSCTKCLIDRRSQWYMNYLNRPKALEWLKQEVRARVAPEEILCSMPDSHAVTSDITTEFYQLTRNKDISSIRIFVNDNISQWDVETFPFKKILTELSLEGVDVDFILPSIPDVKSLSSPDCATLIAEVLKNNFKCLENTLPGELLPLMVVIMNDETVKTYFGKNINTSYSKNWGSGDVFITTQSTSLSYIDINGKQLLNTFSSDNASFMFEYRIKEHSSLDGFFDSLKAPETEKWNRIISNLQGKTVSVKYSDRYLKTPLGCMLLARMISALKNEAHLNLEAIKVVVTNIVSFDDSDVAINVMKDFTNGERRNSFLKDAISRLTGIEPEIQDTGYVEHERCLTVKADNAEVCIRPDAGITNGWAPFGRDNAECADRDFIDNWNINLELFNKQQRGAGILYTVSYKQF